jgi:hypothetical protein
MTSELLQSCTSRAPGRMLPAMAPVLLLLLSPPFLSNTPAYLEDGILRRLLEAL